MTASVPTLQFAINFLANDIFMRYGFSQTFEIFHLSKVCIINLYTVTSSCILTSRHDHERKFYQNLPLVISPY
jgi:hypothetical protein